MIAHNAAPYQKSLSAPDWPLAVTICPWKIRGSAKILAMRGPVSQYEYNSGHDTSWWPEDWQQAYACTRESGRIVMERDDPEVFDAFIKRTGIVLSPCRVTSGRDGGIHYHYDGRQLSYEDWPTQGPIPGGDVKSAGFVPVPGSRHPSGRIYLAAGTSHGTEERWTAEFTRLVEAERAAMGMQRGDSYQPDPLHYGRNNTLLDYKKYLFFTLGIDEDDPEMTRLVLERNRGFSEQGIEPQPEAEVRSTVLRNKRLRRGWTLGEIDYGPETPSDTAGQGGVWVKGNPLPPSPKQRADPHGQQEAWMPCHPLTAPADLKAKLAAEWDGHELSLLKNGWADRGGEPSRQVYDQVMRRLIEGQPVPRDKIDAATWEHLSCTSDNGAVLLTEGEDGQVIAWSDPEEDPAKEPRDPWPGYAGCPEGRNPKAGGYIGRERGRAAVLACLKAKGSDRLAARDACSWIAAHRRELGFETDEDPLGCRYMSEENFGRILRELRAEGLVTVAKEAEHYREMHTWRTLPAGYEVRDDPGMILAHRLKKAFGGMARAPHRGRRTRAARRKKAGRQ